MTTNPNGELLKTLPGILATTAAAIVCAVRNGKQAALMAPTEILAEQHYRGLAPLLEKLGVACSLLTGGMPAKARRTASAWSGAEHSCQLSSMWSSRIPRRS